MDEVSIPPHLTTSALITLGVISLLVVIFAAHLQPASALGSGDFTDTGQNLGNLTSQGVTLGDFDGLNGPDAFVANDGANRVWLNDGSGTFASNGQNLGSLNSKDVDAGDLDGMNGLDVVVANEDGLNAIWMNDGTGQFSAGTGFEGGASRGVALGDLDGDDDLDVFVANNGANTVWLNNAGTLSDSGQALGTANSYAVSLGDVDGDSDIDAIVANNGANTVWINEGGDDGGIEGEFMNSGQTLGSSWSYDIALVDLDGDGDLDAFSANWFPTANQVWINQGGDQLGFQGEFSAGESLGASASLGVALGDLDDVASIDAFVTNNLPAGAKVWLNDGAASFVDSGQALGTDTTSYAVGLADFDGDSDLDAFVAGFGPNRVYLNDFLPPAVFDVDRGLNGTGQEVTYQAGNEAMLPVTLAFPAPVALDVHIDITGPDTWTEVMSFEAGQQMRLLQIFSPTPDPSVEYTLTLSVTLEGESSAPVDQTDELLLIFVDEEQGMEECILCYVEWLVRLLGFEPTFGAMHHVDTSGLENTPQWVYYTATFDYYSPELASIVATHPDVLFQALDTLEAITPVAEGLGDSGSAHVITQEMIDGVNALVDDLEGEASSGLQTFLAHEQAAIDTGPLVGMNAEAAMVELEQQRNFSILYLTIILN